MNATNQRICAWAGPLASVIWLIGLLFLARFIPRYHPASVPPKSRLVTRITLSASGPGWSAFW
jgi:hypothetical protein